MSTGIVIIILICNGVYKKKNVLVVSLYLIANVYWSSCNISLHIIYVHDRL